MIKSNCFTINKHIYIITGCSKGESLNKYGKHEYYYTILNTMTNKRKKLTEKGFKNTFSKYKIEWQKPQVDKYNIIL
jgi:hypothetical protein